MVSKLNSGPPGAVPWPDVRGRLDHNAPFANMFDTPLYRDAVWEQFPPQEYARRYAALRTKMREHQLDVAIVPGGPSHWSFGGGMTWLTGHIEWHALAAYVVVPLEFTASTSSPGRPTSSPNAPRRATKTRCSNPAW